LEFLKALLKLNGSRRKIHQPGEIVAPTRLESLRCVRSPDACSHSGNVFIATYWYVPTSSWCNIVASESALFHSYVDEDEDEVLPDDGTSLRSVIVSALYLVRVGQVHDQSEGAIIVSCSQKMKVK
jgi:hypothetical protein